MKNEFIEYYFNKLRFTPLFQEMATIFENSPYHREGNVLIHTDMVVSHYLSFDSSGDKTFLLGALACAFHDVGKPAAQEVRFSEERGWYNRYAGHEQISAKLWEDFAVTNYQTLKDLFDLTAEDIFVVGWLIQYHLPYQIKRPPKRQALAQTIERFFSPVMFERVLQADCWGRISDDHNQKKAAVNSWCREFRSVYNNLVPLREATERSCVILIGPSGSGKSTYIKQNYDHFPAGSVAIHSMDELRLSRYGDSGLDPKAQYAAAFSQSCDDSEFSKAVQADFSSKLKDMNNRVVIVDNTNLSSKRRRFHIEEARRHGMSVKAVVFVNSLNTIIQRQNTRPDKDVPRSAVENQYKNMQYPSLGEFDSIEIVEPELHLD